MSENIETTKLCWHCSRILGTHNDTVTSRLFIDTPDGSHLPVEKIIVENWYTAVIVDDIDATEYNSVEVKFTNLPPQFDGDIVDYVEACIKAVNPNYSPDPDYKPAA